MIKKGKYFTTSLYFVKIAFCFKLCSKTFYIIEDVRFIA